MIKSLWKQVAISDICINATTNIQLNKIKGQSGNFPVYGASGYIQNIDYYQQDSEYIGVVKDGSGVGRVNIYPAYSSLLSTMQYILPKEGCDLRFLLYALRSLNLSAFSRGAAIPHIYFKDYCKLNINLPSIEEQKKISLELDKIQEALANKNEQLKKLDELIQSKFYEMFGNIVTNEKGWPIKKLEEVGSFARGVSKHRPRNAPELLGGTMPLIQTGDIANAGMCITTYSSTYSDLGVRQSKVWPAGTICITIAANIGKCSILTFDACFPDSVVGYTIKQSEISHIFVYYLFGELQSILEANAPGAAQKNINLQTLNSLVVPLPPLLLQQAFAAYVEKVEKAKAIVIQEIAHLQELLDSRMDFYFRK